MNWGNKLLLTFIVFGTGMSYLVYRAVSTDFQLVEKDYYKKELRYQQLIDDAGRANNLSTAVKLEQKDQEIILQMPDEMKGAPVEGTAWFYCAYDAKKDRKFPLSLDQQAMQQFDRKQIAAGSYTVKINWVANTVSYYTEKRLTIP